MLMRISALLGATLCTGLLIGTSASAQSADEAQCPEGEHELVIVSWGGSWEQAQEKAYYTPFMQACPNVTIVQESSSNEAVAKIRAQSEAGNVTWDLVDTLVSDALRLCDEGLVKEIDHDEWLNPAPNGTPASEDFGDALQSDCHIPGVIYSTAVGYRTDVPDWQGRTPEDICALFDLENFPGKRSLEKRPINNLEWALYCDGVAKEDIYEVLDTEEGLQRALDKLDTIWEETIWWSAGAETPQRLADREAVMGSTYNGRLFSLAVEEKQPVEVIWDMQMLDIGGWTVPEGAEEDDDDLQAIKAFVRFASDTQRLADQASYIAYGPSRASSQPLVGKHADLGIDMAPHMPTNPQNAANAFIYDYEWWADNRDEIDSKFQAWLIR
jgi:putative spermidine/putrescine transport system substrate-binding protein